MNKSLVHVCVPKSVGQIGEIHQFPDGRDQLLVQVRLPKIVDRSGIIYLVPAKGQQITCTSMSA